MKLPMFEKDKANHFIYGVIIYALSALLLAPAFALISVYAAALVKEFYDKHKTNRFGYGDIMATLFGGLAGFFISLTA
jgi:hypothetical protein